MTKAAIEKLDSPRLSDMKIDKASVLTIAIREDTISTPIGPFNLGNFCFLTLNLFDELEGSLICFSHFLFLMN